MRVPDVVPTIEHGWSDAVFLHWRVDAGTVSGLLPQGVRPDVVDGSAWVGVTAYRFTRTTTPPLPFPGRLGAMTQVTVEVPTTDRFDHHAVAFLDVETQHVPGILLARAGIGAPYRFARVGVRTGPGHLSYRSRRAAGRHGPASATFALDGAVGSSGPLLGPGPELAHRDGIHLRHLGRTAWWRRTHRPWDLRPVDVLRLDGTLPAAVGVPGLFDRGPDSAVVGTRTDVTYSWGGTL